MKVGRFLALKQFSRYPDDIARLDYLSGAIDDSIVSAVSSDQHFFPSREHGRQLKGVGVTFARIRTQEYRPKLGEGLGARKRSVGQNKHLLALRNILEAVTARITKTVGNVDFGGMSVGIQSTGL